MKKEQYPPGLPPAWRNNPPFNPACSLAEAKWASQLMAYHNAGVLAKRSFEIPIAWYDGTIEDIQIVPKTPGDPNYGLDTFLGLSGRAAGIIFAPIQEEFQWRNLELIWDYRMDDMLRKLYVKGVRGVAVRPLQGNLLINAVPDLLMGIVDEFEALGDENQELGRALVHLFTLSKAPFDQEQFLNNSIDIWK